jgi:3'-phosphoadenosine 5'-phosphosulfate (PAPS) 3'-phosphatase
MRLAELTRDLAAPERSRLEAAISLFWRQAIGSARLQGRVAELLKADQSPVTIVDLLHQTQVQQLLRRDFVGDALLCEEPRNLQERHAAEAAALSREVYGLEIEPGFDELPSEGERVWVLDPIDGTKGFLGGRYFALALACFVAGVPRFAVMAVPGGDHEKPLGIDRSIAFAIAGRGSWSSAVVEGTDPTWASLAEPASRRSGPVRVAVSLAHGGPLAERLRGTAGIELVELDSQAKYLAVAHGDIDAYLRAARDDGKSDLLWDHLPGGLVAREAGCVVRHFDGAPMVYEPREAIAFHGGVVCLRERDDGRVSETVASLLART